MSGFVMTTKYNKVALTYCIDIASDNSHGTRAILCRNVRGRMFSTLAQSVAFGTNTAVKLGYLSWRPSAVKKRALAQDGGRR